MNGDQLAIIMAAAIRASQGLIGAAGYGYGSNVADTAIGITRRMVKEFNEIQKPKEPDAVHDHL